MPTQEPMYARLRQAGFDLQFKPVVSGPKHPPKGNVDADLVLKVMVEMGNFDRAVLVSGDGDFYSLIRYLVQEDRLAAVLSPNRAFCSALVKRESKGRLWFVEDLRAKLSS